MAIELSPFFRPDRKQNILTEKEQKQITAVARLVPETDVIHEEEAVFEQPILICHGSADNCPGNPRPRLSSSLRELRVLRGIHCDWTASLLNATGAIPHEYFDDSSLDQVVADQTVLGRHSA